ncbi:MAG: hypothetical protein P8170_21470 [Gemmatimonadota bacterium]
MARLAVVISVMVLFSACDERLSPTRGEVTGTWTATLEGTVFQGEDGTGETTSLTLTLEQSGTQVTGSEGFTDTMGRSGVQPVSGTFLGLQLSYSRLDFDPDCGDRTVTGIGRVTSVDPGSTMRTGIGASAAGACPMLADSLVYTKQ